MKPMRKYRWLKILSLNIICVGALWLMAIQDGYQINEVLRGLAGEECTANEIPTNLLSCARWIWVIFSPVVCATALLEQENEYKYLEVYRYASYKKWRFHLLKMLLFHILIYIGLLFGSMSVWGQTIKNDITSIILLSVHIFLLMAFLFLINIYNYNLMIVVLLIAIVESSLIFMGRGMGIPDCWNLAMWSMNARMSICEKIGFWVKICLLEMGLACGLCVLSTLKREAC